MGRHLDVVETAGHHALTHEFAIGRIELIATATHRKRGTHRLYTSGLGLRTGIKAVDDIATLHIDACIAKSVTKYSSSEDYFKKQMTESGFNMKGWCLYKRMRTPFLDFLKQVASTYKDYHLVNLIQIG